MWWNGADQTRLTVPMVKHGGGTIMMRGLFSLVETKKLVRMYAKKNMGQF